VLFLVGGGICQFGCELLNLVDNSIGCWTIRCDGACWDGRIVEAGLVEVGCANLDIHWAGGLCGDGPRCPIPTAHPARSRQRFQSSSGSPERLWSAVRFHRASSSKKSVEARAFDAAITPALKMPISWLTTKSPWGVVPMIRRAASAHAAPRWHSLRRRLCDPRRFTFSRRRPRWLRYRTWTRLRWTRPEPYCNDRNDKYQDEQHYHCDFLPIFQISTQFFHALTRGIPLTFRLFLIGFGL
jgi:hypothetical protein